MRFGWWICGWGSDYAGGLLVYVDGASGLGWDMRTVRQLGASGAGWDMRGF